MLGLDFCNFIRNKLYNVYIVKYHIIINSFYIFFYIFIFFIEFISLGFTKSSLGTLLINPKK